MRSSVAILLLLVSSPPSPPATAGGPSTTPPQSGGYAQEGRGEGGGWIPADPHRTWSFPADHWAHPGHRTEWWYFTGTLESLDAPGRRFGYQVTFFSVGLVPRPPALDSAWATGGAVMVHLAVTDVASGKHAFSEVLWRASPLLAGLGARPDPVLAWARAPAGQPGRWTLALEGERLEAGVGPRRAPLDGAGAAPPGTQRETFRLDARDGGAGVGVALTARPVKPPALQGPNGHSRKSDLEGFASSYYSVTRLATEGRLELGGEAHRVRGTSWMDKEFGSSQLAPSQVGWDWWSLRLADGRDLMLYVLRRADGAADFRKATLVERDGAVRLLAPSEWTAEARGRWRSDATGAEYPSGWDVAVPGAGIRLRVEPEVRASENVSRLVPGLAYWEGPVRLTGEDGAPAGEGYVELTGYGERARPPI